MDPGVRLRARGLSYRYPDGTEALSGIDLDVRSGEFVGVLGSNGSGKTTLLGALDGLLKDYRGSVRLDGQEVRALTPREIYRKVGLVFQNPDNQLFAATVAEDVAFGPHNMGFEEEEVHRRVLRALKAVDMHEHARKGIHNLSFGQKKRVSIAGLLAMGHEVLLMDEPTGGLDPMGEYAMMELLMALNREGVTIVMATHSVDLVPLVLSTRHILSHGRITRGGSPEEVFTAPEDMARVKLRLPHIAELIWQLRDRDGVTFPRLPHTVGEARRLLRERLAGA
ncbi:MAG: ATP-binding cassette domain-containing protein [Nitrospirota bacterium]